MAKLVVVGTKRLTLPLCAIGFEPVEAADAAQLEGALDRLSVDRSVALVVCGESQAQDGAEAVARFRKFAHAVVLVVPDGPAPKGLGRAAVRKIIEEAAGVDLLGKSEGPG
jgi:vacuolar-type H+-ATPase subunit F/Vma7